MTGRVRDCTQQDIWRVLWATTDEAQTRMVSCRMQSYAFGNAILPLQRGMGSEAAALRGLHFNRYETALTIPTRDC